MKRIPMLCMLMLISVSICAQGSSVEHYIATYKDIAVSEMIRTGVPASITLAQGILESQFGTSPLAKKSNNHFGIKCKKGWTGDTVLHDDDAKNECFRSYCTPEDSFKDHSDFLKNNQRYAKLFTLNITDYKSWAIGLKRAGYATNKLYAAQLISCIEKHKLHEYDIEMSVVVQ